MTILEKHEIHPSVLGLLLFVNLNDGKDEYIIEMLRTRMFEFNLEDKTVYEMMLEQDLVKLIKTGRKEEVYRVRLSDKGKNIVKEAVWSKPPHELASSALDFLEEEYNRVGAGDRVVKNDKILKNLSDFLHFKPGYTMRMWKAVVRAYCNQFDYDKKYMNAMDTLLFKPSNLWQKNWNDADCPLIKFIDRNQDKIKNEYKLIKE